LAVVFGGGGVKAAAHAGAWRALTEAGLSPSYYCGTSMGAVVAACFSAGLSYDDVRNRFAGVTRQSVARSRRLLSIRGLTAPSLFYIEPLREVIERLVPVRRFGDLNIPLTVTAVDLDTGALLLFGAGGEDVALVDALLASCALPVFYPPVMIGNRRCADGGLRSVLPLGVVAATPADLVIAVDTGPGFDEPRGSGSGMPALLDAHNSATGVLMASNTGDEIALWKATAGRPPLLYVRPRVDRNVTFNVELAEKYALEGYRATKEVLAQGGVMQRD
jgi:NTE family protein